MYNKAINRKLILFLMVGLAVSLTSLGIRLPSATGISSSGKPKPRPRAIIKNQIKTCKQIVKQFPQVVAIAGFRPLSYCPEMVLPSLPAAECCCLFVVAAQTLPRAPPLLS